MTEPNPSSLVWAVDPLSENRNFQRSAAWVIRDFTRAIPALVQPVYLLRHPYAQMDVPFEIPPQVVGEIQKAAQENLNQVLRRIEIRGIQPLKIISGLFAPLRKGVDEILNFAREQNATLIVVSTHGRKGISRLWMGSFTENLMLKSTLPVLIVNPGHQKVANFRNILFPTDFSDESKEAFQKVIRLAKSLDSEITVFHKLIYVLTPTLEYAFTVNPIYKEAFDREMEARRKDAETWAEIARKEGVRTRISIDAKRIGSVADAILQEAEKRPGLIALASQSRPISTVLLGSTTRGVIRSSPYPVWVIHTDLTQHETLRKAG